jgi:DegV family protein with EDD domain
MNGTVYGKDTSLEVKEFYDRMRNGEMPTTMAANPEELQTMFEKYLKAGKDVLHLAFSSELSSSYNNAAVVANELNETYTDNKVIVIDTLSASLGQGLVVHKAVELRKAGKTIEETADWVEANKLHFCHQFTVDDLNHLYRGGRVSKLTAVAGTLIHVKPILHVSDEGRLIPIGKVRGRKKSLIALVDNMERTIGSYRDKNDIVFISHGDALEEAQYVASLVKERFGIENFLINPVSPTIGAHSGPGTIALFYLGERR